MSEQPQNITYNFNLGGNPQQGFSIPGASVITNEVSASIASRLTKIEKTLGIGIKSTIDELKTHSKNDVDVIFSSSLVDRFKYLAGINKPKKKEEPKKEESIRFDKCNSTDDIAKVFENSPNRTKKLIEHEVSKVEDSMGSIKISETEVSNCNIKTAKDLNEFLNNSQYKSVDVSPITLKPSEVTDKEQIMGEVNKNLDKMITEASVETLKEFVKDITETRIKDLIKEEDINEIILQRQSKLK